MLFLNEEALNDAFWDLVCTCAEVMRSRGPQILESFHTYWALGVFYECRNNVSVSVDRDKVHGELVLSVGCI